MPSRYPIERAIIARWERHGRFVSNLKARATRIFDSNYRELRGRNNATFRESLASPSPIRARSLAEIIQRLARDRYRTRLETARAERTRNYVLGGA